LAFAGAVPTKLAAHLLHLLHGRPDLTDRWGYHVRAIHYYDPVPDFRRISAEGLAQPRLSAGIDFHADGQLALLHRLGDAFGQEIAALANEPGPSSFDFANSYFAGLDAAVYYALIRDLGSRLVVEIGSGYSTQIATKALARNASAGRTGRLVCVEPYPEPRLTQSGAKYELIEKPVQDVPLEVFESLEAGDILMIDSSHVAKTGSDVCFELLEILPRLKLGVWVHVHDIFLPTDYPAEWVLGRRLAFNEQYMLEAFLAFNSAFSVQLANAWLWGAHRQVASSLYSGSADGTDPASFWMRRDA
jgi:hypothetical protein